MKAQKHLSIVFMSAILWSLGAGEADAQKIYWTDIGSSRIQRANLDGSVVEDLVTTSVILPTGIALDVSAGKMYWTEASPADFMIMRADLDGANGELLVTGLTSPSGIALDTAAGKMYWTDIGTGKIQRANLDGTALEDLVTIEALTPVGIALDLSIGKMYWTEGSPADFMILRADLERLAADKPLPRRPGRYKHRTSSERLGQPEWNCPGCSRRQDVLDRYRCEQDPAR